jgi:hypothetical protein
MVSALLTCLTTTLIPMATIGAVISPKRRAVIRSREFDETVRLSATRQAT